MNQLSPNTVLVNVLRTTLLLLVGGLFLLVGCGEPTTPYHAVEGKVTLDGDPLPNASVSFLPTGDEGISSTGHTDEQGVYRLLQSEELVGAQVGEYLVKISTYREGRDDTDPPFPEIPELVPMTYNSNSDLKREVKPIEKNVFDFSLETSGS